jgi:hypothetical protein
MLNSKKVCGLGDVDLAYWQASSTGSSANEEGRIANSIVATASKVSSHPPLIRFLRTLPCISTMI